MKVSNMTSRTSGRAVPNQFIIERCPAGTFWQQDSDKGDETALSRGDAFQSYETVIAYITYIGRCYLDRDHWDYSVTTSRYRNQFLGLNTGEIKDKIANGEILLIDLNR